MNSKNTDKLRVFEAFSGIGAQRKALENIGVPHEVVAISEIDKFAIKSYEAMYGQTNNLGDISKVNVDDIPDHDLFTYSFPCQDLSVAGKLSGLEKGSGTRSSLLYECERVIHGKKPKYLLLENVKNLVGKKFKPAFDEWLNWLEQEGYSNYWKVLNAKDYGVPQNRERVFVVSILGTGDPYVFPEKKILGTRLKDVLEDEVEEKYYLSDEIQKRFHADVLPRVTNNSPDTSTEISNKNVHTEVVGKIDGWNNEQLSRVYHDKGISPTLNTMQGGNRQPKIIEEPKVENPLKGKTDYGWHFEQNVYNSKGITRTVKAGGGSGNIPKVIEELPAIGASRGRNPENTSDRTIGTPTQQMFEVNTKGVSNTITGVQKDNLVLQRNYRIRKLTPLECWRLMGFSDEDFYKAEQVNSNTQLYKQAGNSIVVPVLEAIFKNLFKEVR